MYLKLLSIFLYNYILQFIKLFIKIYYVHTIETNLYFLINIFLPIYFIKIYCTFNYCRQWPLICTITINFICVYSISFNISNYQPQSRVQTFKAKSYHNNDKALPHDLVMTTHYHLWFNYKYIRTSYSPCTHNCNLHIVIFRIIINPVLKKKKLNVYLYGFYRHELFFYFCLSPL